MVHLDLSYKQDPDFIDKRVREQKAYLHKLKRQPYIIQDPERRNLLICNAVAVIEYWVKLKHDLARKTLFNSLK